ncbi:hypothetical protein EVAR_44735_1 [Eumeta japonica]|uniref:Uncharacterized protein n=1 Tax=Eumeta variegata TaxID=151549 RepID=A0A4C1XF52_EUMVA|nr:hypothetical protein EVAR_44735_1 [Eumeta japonica]
MRDKIRPLMPAPPFPPRPPQAGARPGVEKIWSLVGDYQNTKRDQRDESIKQLFKAEVYLHSENPEKLELTYESRDGEKKKIFLCPLLAPPPETCCAAIKYTQWHSKKKILRLILHAMINGRFS